MLRGEITMVKDPELKGEHFHGNNPDMKLDFEKPSKAEIDEMNYKKPITSFKDAIPEGKPSTEEMYMGITPEIGYASQTPNVDYADDARRAKNSDRNTL